ncbi:MAG: hypothetical protein ACOCXG_00385 [Nanoarchaeota archaeon]
MIEVLSKKYELDEMRLFEVDLNRLYELFKTFCVRKKKVFVRSFIVKNSFFNRRKISSVSFKENIYLEEFKQLIEIIGTILENSEKLKQEIWKLAQFDKHELELEKEHERFTTFVSREIEIFITKLDKIKQNLELLPGLVTENEKDLIADCLTELESFSENCFEFLEQIRFYDSRYKTLLSEDLFFDIRYIIRDSRYEKDLSGLCPRDQFLARNIERRLLFANKEEGKDRKLTELLSKIKIPEFKYRHAYLAGCHTYRMIYIYEPQKKVLLLVRILVHDKVPTTNKNYDLIILSPAVQRELDQIPVSEE